MAAPLNPLPIDIGFGNPSIGPWFENHMTPGVPFTLGAPDPDLAITLGAFSSMQWLPPAAGTLGLFVATSPRPIGLAALRKADGTPAFADGKLVALFRLLPEVEDRLHKLTGKLPTVDGTPNPAGLPTRPRVRWFALEIPTSDPSLLEIEPCIQPAMPTTLTVPAARAQYLGLALDRDAVDTDPLRNALSPMADLKRPGDFLGGVEYLWRFSTDTAGTRLWTFDSGGRPIDPGAVAEWWRFLADIETQNTLWASGDPARRLTMPVDPMNTVHLVNAHEGPLVEPMLSRVAMTGALPATGVVRRQQLPTIPIQLALQGAPPQHDSAPIPRIAVLPNGVYNPVGATLWVQNPDPLAPVLARDFVRVAAVDVERHLTGQARVSSGPPGSDPARFDDQERPSTRIRVERTTAPTLLATTDLAADAVTAVGASPGQTRLVSSVLERDWAGLDAFTGPDVAPAIRVEAIVAHPLAGGGLDDGGTVKNQRALVELDFPSDQVGAWVRVWPQTLDHETARHVRLDGGSAIVRATPTGARASIVVTLADGSVDPEALMGVDVMVVTRRGSRLIADQRFARPVPVATPAVAFASIAGDVLVCETGVLAAPAALTGSVPSGATLVVLGATPALVDRATLPAAVFTADTVIRNLQAGDIVELTQPAFVGTPDGELAPAIASTGATVNRREREGLVRSLAIPSSPLPTLERLEIAASCIDPTNAIAALAATPALARYHELFPHQLGHPGAPGAVDVHGTGVRLTGRAAVALAELVRDRTEPASLDLATAAATPFVEPPPPVGPGAWAAPLRTVSAGIEGEAILLQALALSSVYPFGQELADALGWWSSNVGVTIPLPVVTALASVARALDRRVLASAKGAREAAISLQRAFADAQDLVYIETPALDTLAIGPSSDRTEVIAKLIARLGENRSLQVVICVPVHAMPGAPAGYKRVRNQLMLDALRDLRAAGGSRIAVFSPSAGPGRTLRLASTTVVVDDVYALTGTTHLSRRGLSFDSSFAAAVFDEVLDAGRPAEVRQFRRRLVAERLGLPVSLVPNDPADLVASIKRVVKRAGGRIAPFVLPPAELPVTDADKDAWNRDGATIPTDFDLLGWLGLLTADVRSEVEAAANRPAP